MNDPYTEILGPAKFRSWSRETPTWWFLYRTNISGCHSLEEKKVFDKCSTNYYVFFDHSMDADARLLAIRVMDRDDTFMAAKVSKFARDGEKVLVFLGKDDSRRHKLASVCSETGFKLALVRPHGEKTENEKLLDQKYNDYLTYLSRAFAPTVRSPGIHIDFH